MPRKDSLLADLQSQLERAIFESERRREEAQSESNRHIGRMESRYDTFKEEAQYLADSHARTTSRLREDLRLLGILAETIDSSHTVVGVGSAFTLKSGVTSNIYLMVPSVGGTHIYADGHDVITISAESDLAKVLIGKKAGDSFMFRDKKWGLQGVW